MKKYLSIVLGIALIPASCTKQETSALQANSNQPCEMTVNVNMPELSKASAYDQAQTYEAQVNEVQILVFDKTSGKIDKYYNAGTSLSGIKLSTSTGEKNVWAVINGDDCSEIAALSNLEGKECGLDANSLTETDGFLMTGTSDITLVAGENILAITVSRIAGRVALVSVKNNLPSAYGAITIDAVWLANGVGKQNYSGTAEIGGWFNKQSRSDENPQVKSHILDGDNYKASYETLTYKYSGQTVNNASTFTPDTPYLFYTYANDADTSNDGFKSSFDAQRSMLVVKTSIKGETYYYPVCLDVDIVRNTAYTVAMTISSLGSDEPNKPVSKGTLEVSITVDPWSPGAVFEPEI